jgi:DNA (cytosine-5)-methyltransferase 1
MNPYRVLDLFSGIGGFSIGLERAGFETVAFCEQDGYARRVLRKHWPHVWLYEDVRTLTAKRLRKDGLDPNVIVGGFPCQDISCAGRGKGIEGERSGLWSEMLRLIKEVKPLWVVAENVPALRSRGADRVLADLEGAGYAATPIVVGAWAVGAQHKRDRVWMVAHAPGAGCKAQPEQCREPAEERPADSAHARRPALADPDSSGWVQGSSFREEESRWQSFPLAAFGSRWEAEPAVGRVVDGIPARLDRLKCLGNAVVPLIPELIGRAIIEWTAATRTEAAAA